MTELQHIQWKFPASKNKSGKSRGYCDIKHVIVIESNLFPEPTIIASDLHSWTKGVFQLLNEYVHLNRCVVITAGDMAGMPLYGCDGNPTDYYIYMRDKCKEFYYVQGNHDRPDILKRDVKLRNTNGNFCNLSIGKVVKSSIGTIAGVHGTISNRKHPYKSSEQVYLRRVSKLLKQKPDFLITHETPALPLKPECRKYGDYIARGNQELYKLSQQHPVKGYFYGHCHHQSYNMTDKCSLKKNVKYYNVDARILIFKPTNVSIDDLLKKELCTLHFDSETAVYNDDCWTIPENSIH
jgi:predicted phosphodiesterase